MGPGYLGCMRTRPAAALSVAGVLAAGLVAAVVNAQALTSSGERGNALLASTELAIANTPTNESPTTLPTAGTTTVQAADAGYITFGTDNDQLQLVAATPSAGWSITAIAATGTTSVTVDFTSAASTLRVTATLLSGEVSATITTDTSQATTSTSLVTPPPTNDDGHKSDDHKSDDHDD